jgi:L-threonylcarbamoyladenylate synthase
MVNFVKILNKVKIFTIKYTTIMQIDISESLVNIKNGKIILHKTDTIWGLACNVSDENAVKKLKEIKNRPDDKAFILLISDISQLSIYVEKVPDIAWDLVEFAENPLTVIYPKGKNVPKIALADDGSIAIRLVKNGPCKELIYKFGKAIVSTSANISGEKSPKNFKEIDEKIIQAVDYIEVSNLPETEMKPSTIVKLGINGDFSFIRK